MRRRARLSKRAGPRAQRLTIRSFREGDERALAHLFNQFLAPFIGPTPVTPASWRSQYRRHGWSAPSLADRDCCRIALRGGKVIGYALTDYEPMWEKGTAMVQELCAAEGEDAREIAHALLADAEPLARRRGKDMIALCLSDEGGLCLRAAEEMGFELPNDDGGVFMATITNLRRFLIEIQGELSRRLAGSLLKDWAGSVRLSSGDMTAGLRLGRGAVKIVALRGTPDIAVTIEPQALPLIMLGRMEAGEAFLQHLLSVTAADGQRALRLLDVLFPRVPLYLPRAQWW